MTIEDYFFSSLDSATIEKILLGAILCNAEMDLSDNEKAIARTNIGAGREDRKFMILGYFDSVDDLPPFPTAGDAYGVGTSDYTYTVIEPESQSNPAEEGYYVRVNGEFVQTTDTSPVEGTIYYERTAPYDIYIWDGVNKKWINNGPLSTGSEVIDDSSNDVYHVLSSARVRKMFEDFQVDSARIADNAVTGDKIENGSISKVFRAVLSGGTWLGNIVSKKLSPNGTSKSYSIGDTPSSLLKVEFLVAGLVLKEGVDYMYSNGTITFTQTPASGIETYEVTYHTTKPPYSTDVSVPGLLATDNPIVDLVPDATNYTLAQSQLHEWSEIFKMEAKDDLLTVYCHYPVSSALPLKILCVRK